MKTKLGRRGSADVVATVSIVSSAGSNRFIPHLVVTWLHEQIDNTFVDQTTVSISPGVAQNKRTSMPRVILLLVASLITFSARAADKPNFILILADDLGYGELGFQGYSKDCPTPHLDAMAARG